ncbi:hypothetical protein [Nonlabens tegetincola]|uniref:hypothetical protein n=1 Tax=Nonlabens tegetincola TaxID=323273 RepID=UPI000CF467BB|nr:hypothetical protein [Nonlabens tegetincola]PQJ19457.1 hypothetical protein BST93_06815 [Nonlabens tegetincola]
MKLTQPLFIFLLLCCLSNKCVAQNQPFKIDSLVTINLAEGIDLSHKYSNRHQTNEVVVFKQYHTYYIIRKKSLSDRIHFCDREELKSFYKSTIEDFIDNNSQSIQVAYNSRFSQNGVYQAVFEYYRNHKLEPLHYDTRLLVIKNYLYQVSIIQPKNKHSVYSNQDFFDSIQFNSKYTGINQYAACHHNQVKTDHLFKFEKPLNKKTINGLMNLFYLGTGIVITVVLVILLIVVLRKRNNN